MKPHGEVATRRPTRGKKGRKMTTRSTNETTFTVRLGRHSVQIGLVRCSRAWNVHRKGLLRYLIGWPAEARPRSSTYNATANSANATASRLFAGSSTANS